MPRRKGYVIKPIQGRAAIEMAERLVTSQGLIRRERIEPSITNLTFFQHSILAVVNRAKVRKIATAEISRARISTMLKDLVTPTPKLHDLYAELTFSDSDDAVVSMYRQSLLTEKEYQSRPSRPMEPSERGQRLKRAVIECRDALAAFKPQYGPLGLLVKGLADDCYSQIIEELDRLRILRFCAYCSDPMFPASRRKVYCAVDFEGRNCSANARSQRSYRKRNPR